MNEQAGRYAGKQFGNYQLLRLLGEGGSAEVYLGKHLYLGTEAALKILNTRLKANEFAQFRTEARTLSALQHPNIVRILDFGREDDVPFLVMNYASHGSLGQLHPAGSRVLLATVVTYVNGVASALQYAHDHQLVHRDIKPDNLLLGSSNEPLLSDFGIAVVAHNTGSLHTQEVIGTVTYMAPEQLHGKARPASDQYALAVVVYEWLCGEPPFAGIPIEVALQHLDEPPPPLRAKAPAISPAVERVVLKALAKEPQERFASVQEFASALARASADTSDMSWEVPACEQSSEESPASERSKNLPVPEQSNSEEVPAPRRHKEAPAAHRRSLLLIALSILLALSVIIGANTWWIAGHRPVAPAPDHKQVHITPGITSTVPVSTAACTDTMGWPTFGFDAGHTEYNPSEHILNPSNIPALQTVWTSDTGYALNPPVLANGILYISTSQNVDSVGAPVPIDTLYAINCQTGNNEWHRQLKSESPRSPNSAAQSDIYTASVVDGVLYAYTASGTLYALNALTGVPMWTTSVITSSSDDSLNLAPIVVAGILYLHANTGNVYAIMAKTGAILWTAQTDIDTDRGGEGISVPAVANGMLYVGGSQYLYAFDAQKGNELWRGEVDGIIPFTPVVAQNSVYVAADSGNVFAFNAVGCGSASCQPLWKVYFGIPQGDPNVPQILAPPAIANGVLYIGTIADPSFGGGYLFAIDASTGATLWRAGTGDSSVGGEVGTYTSPVVANGVLYFINAEGELFTFNASGCGSTTCTSFWSTSLRNDVGSGYSITISDGSVYVSTQESFYALRLLDVHE